MNSNRICLEHADPDAVRWWKWWISGKGRACAVAITSINESTAFNLNKPLFGGFEK